MDTQEPQKFEEETQNALPDVVKWIPELVRSTPSSLDAVLVQCRALRLSSLWQLFAYFDKVAQQAKEEGAEDTSLHPSGVLSPLAELVEGAYTRANTLVATMEPKSAKALLRRVFFEGFSAGSRSLDNSAINLFAAHLRNLEGHSRSSNQMALLQVMQEAFHMETFFTDFTVFNEQDAQVVGQFILSAISVQIRAAVSVGATFGLPESYLHMGAFMSLCERHQLEFQPKESSEFAESCRKLFGELLKKVEADR